LKSWKDAVKSITEQVGDDIKYIMKVSLARHNSSDTPKDYKMPDWHKFKTFYRFEEFPKEFEDKTITDGIDSHTADLAWMGYFEGVKDGLKMAPENCPNSSSSQISEVEACWLKTKCRACKFAFEDAKEDLHKNNNHAPKIIFSTEQIRYERYRLFEECDCLWRAIYCCKLYPFHSFNFITSHITICSSYLDTF